jgi:hypothetical protein
MAQKHYWLTAIVTPSTPAITHGEAMSLKAYFDENPSSRDAGEVTEGKNTKSNKDNFRASAEKTGSKALAKSGVQQFDFQLTEAEYNAGSFDLYFWVEPYGRAALRKGSLVTGRLKVGLSQCQKGGLPKRPPNAMDGDEQIVCEFELVQSVVNFIVDEMNTNGKSADVKSMAQNNDRANSGETVNTPRGRRSKYPGAGKEASDLLGCRTHSSEGGWQDGAQDLIFCGFSKKGGQWDHKPRIRPIWGTNNRLGNRGFVYYYDSWSNIHFGFVARKGGFTQEKALSGAEWAQLIDQLSGKDDPSDIEAIKEGYALGGLDTVTIQNIIQIFERNSQWDGR